MTTKTNTSESRHPNTWLIVERLENWEVDRDSDFSRFGLPERLERRASEVRKGDRLVAYVSSGISAFADVRQATSDGVEKLRFGGDYDTAFPICIRTESLFSLDRPQWVPIRTLVSELSFTKGKRDWRQLMRNSLRLLSQSDAERIIDCMKGARSDAA